jgi:hypothetical protein
VDFGLEKTAQLHSCRALEQTELRRVKCQRRLRDSSRLGWDPVSPGFSSLPEMPVKVHGGCVRRVLCVRQDPLFAPAGAKTKLALSTSDRTDRELLLRSAPESHPPAACAASSPFPLPPPRASPSPTHPETPRASYLTGSGGLGSAAAPLSAAQNR